MGEEKRNNTNTRGIGNVDDEAKGKRERHMNRGEERTGAETQR